MNNKKTFAFGLATYSFGKDPGTLVAQWTTHDGFAASENKAGTGLARSRNCESPNSFVGVYDVEYWTEDGTLQFELHIEENDRQFMLTWKSPNQANIKGYGFVCGNMLVAGYED